MDPGRDRYERGEYGIAADSDWKAKQMEPIILKIPDLGSILRYGDVGCHEGSVLASLRERLLQVGLPLRRVVGYDIAPLTPRLKERYPDIVFKGDFLDDDEEFDLVTLLDVLEHVTAPRDFLATIGKRARYVALHVPLDDRLGVALARQFNRRVGSVGHLSFWNEATAINLATAAGLQPLWSKLTPGFLAPSGRERLVQLFALPVRLLGWAVAPGLAAKTVGGLSLGLLCRGRLE